MDLKHINIKISNIPSSEHNNKLAEAKDMQQKNASEILEQKQKRQEIWDLGSGNYSFEGVTPYSRKIEALEKRTDHYKNQEKALLNKGTLSSFKDDTGKEYKNVPNFTKIKTENIDFSEDDILNTPTPPYIPYINEDVFRRKGYIFDAIRIGKDAYLLSGNSYKNRTDEMLEQNLKVSGDINNLNILTLDQLVLTIDYYTIKAKAKINERANEQTLRNKKRWEAMSDKQHEYYLNQADQNYVYKQLSKEEKKKISFEDFKKLTWQEKYKIVPFYAKGTRKRIKSVLKSNTMWASFHDMYQQFINKDAWLTTKFGKKYEGVGSRFGNPETFKYWHIFTDFLNYKLIDIAENRKFNNNNEKYKKGLETAFGKSNTNDALLRDAGILVKRQNGDDILPNEIETIKDAWLKMNKHFGNLIPLAENSKLIVSHAANKYIFSGGTFAGMYIPSMDAIAISHKFGETMFQNIFAHEAAHFIDTELGRKAGQRHITDNFESLPGTIAFNFRKNMNKKSQSNYINNTKECFARAMEQYFAIQAKTDDTENINYFRHKNYVNKENFNEKIKPDIKKFLSENFEKFNVKETDAPEPNEVKYFEPKKLPSINLILKYAWIDIWKPNKLSDNDLLKAYQYTALASYLYRKNVNPLGYKDSRDHHILPQLSDPSRLKLLSDEMKKRGLDKNNGIDFTSLPIAQKTFKKSPELVEGITKQDKIKYYAVIYNDMFDNPHSRIFSEDELIAFENRVRNNINSWEYIKEVPNKHIPYDYVIKEIKIKDGKFPEELKGGSKKKPYELTLMEYFKSLGYDGIKDGNITLKEKDELGKTHKTKLGRTRTSFWLKEKRKKHKDYVTQALKEGKTIPKEVLNDYPELKTKEEKQPYEMTKAEWDIEREKIKPNYAQSNLTRNSSFSAIRKFDRLTFLLYEAKKHLSEKLKRAYLPKSDKNHIEMTSEEADDIQFELSIPITHKDVIEKALKEGKTIPKEVLNDYPELKSQKETHKQQGKRLLNEARTLRRKAKEGNLSKEDKAKFKANIKARKEWRKKADTSVNIKGIKEVRNYLSSEKDYLDYNITTPKHAKEYGIIAKKPLFLKRIWIPEECRNSGVGEKALKRVEKYAKDNDCDVIFGYIASGAEYTKDKVISRNPEAIKIWLKNNGYSVNMENADFYKNIKGGKELGRIENKIDLTKLTTEELANNPEFYKLSATEQKKLVENINKASKETNKKRKIKELEEFNLLLDKEYSNHSIEDLRKKINKQVKDNYGVRFGNGDARLRELNHLKDYLQWRESKQQTPKNEIKISENDLSYSIARNAHSNTSFDPEKRAKQEQKGYVSVMTDYLERFNKLAKNEAQKQYVLDNFPAFKQKYISLFEDYLTSRSRVASTMITGGSNFNVRRNQKANNAADNKYEKLSDWQTKATQRMIKGIKALKTQADIDAESQRNIKEFLADNLATIYLIDTGKEHYTRSSFTNSIKRFIKKMAEHGQYNNVVFALNYIKEAQEKYKDISTKPIFTSKNEVWDFDKLAKQVSEEKKEAEANKTEKELFKFDGGFVKDNQPIERIQIMFDNIPDAELRATLKKNGWRWSPHYNAWQRKNTQAGISSAKRILITPSTKQLNTKH